jgi:hypothetical protein
MQTGDRSRDHTLDGLIWEKFWRLSQVANLVIGGMCNNPFIWLLPPGKDPEKRGLPGTVGAHEGEFLQAGEADAYTDEDRPMVVVIADSSRAKRHPTPWFFQ